MDERPLGKTGLRVSEIGICLPPDAALAGALARRAAGEGVTFLVASDGASHAAARVAAPGTAVALARGDAWVLEAPGGSAASDADFVVGRFNLADQDVNRTVFAPAYRDGRGVVAVHVLKGGALAGRVAHAPHGALVLAYASLVKPNRTLAQAAIQFALANEYVSCAVVRVSSAAHLLEAVGAPDAEPLTTSELEQIFETYANRYDPK